MYLWIYIYVYTYIFIYAHPQPYTPQQQCRERRSTKSWRGWQREQSTSRQCDRRTLVRIMGATLCGIAPFLSQTMYRWNGLSRVNSPTKPSTYCLLLLIVNIVNNKLTVLWESWLERNQLINILIEIKSETQTSSPWPKVDQVTMQVDQLTEIWSTHHENWSTFDQFTRRRRLPRLE